MICNHESWAGMHKPLPWLVHQPGFNRHVLNADTIPANKQGETQKKEESGKIVQPVKELPKSETKTGDVIKAIKQVPKAKKQPKPMAVQGPRVPVKVPVIKTPKVVIRKIKL